MDTSTANERQPVEQSNGNGRPAADAEQRYWAFDGNHTEAEVTEATAAEIRQRLASGENVWLLRHDRTGDAGPAAEFGFTGA
jgi:hypothetical protein